MAIFYSATPISMLPINTWGNLFPYRSYAKNTALYGKHVQELFCTWAFHVPFFIYRERNWLLTKWISLVSVQNIVTMVAAKHRAPTLTWISLAIQPLSQQKNTYNKGNKQLQENQSAQSRFTVSIKNKVQHLSWLC